MTLGRIEEILDEVEEDTSRDYTPETQRIIREVLASIRVKLGIDTDKDWET